MKKIKIRKGTLEEAVLVSGKIPEFDKHLDLADYEKHLDKKHYLILVAEIETELVGFKVGYFENNYFYSWMGGIVPAFRRKSIAASLAKVQEEWVLTKGVNTIRFKTQNKFKNMLLFAIASGFEIIGTVPFEGGEGFKILLEKTLNR